MPQLQIRLLGQFLVILDGQVVSGFVSDKARALLAYLAAEGQSLQRRETLAHLLWPGKTESRARANLRCALANLRKVIGDTQAETPFLKVTRHDIKIQQGSNIWVDVNHLTEIHGIETPSSENISQFFAILEIYKGEFLIGFNLPDSLPFDEWALLKREQYARMMDTILCRVSDYYEKKGAYRTALPFAWRHVELEPWQEKARCQLMRILVRTEQRDEALQQYHDLEDELGSALHIKPGKNIRELYKTIKSGNHISLSDKPSKVRLEEPLTPPKFLKENRPNMSPPHETFVARKEELDRLHTHLDAAISGRGCVVMVAGETGSGKSVLVREFIQQAQSRFPDLISAVGYSNAFTGVGDPYLPFREILYQLSGDISGRYKAGILSQQNALNLWHNVPKTCQALLTYGPDLIDNLLPGETILAFTSPYAETSPHWYRELQKHIEEKRHQPAEFIQQANLFSQFTNVFQKISEHVPLLLFIDDLQWADGGSISILFQFLKQIKHHQILLIGAFRSDEVGLKLGDKVHPLIPVLHEIQREFGDVLINLGSTSGRDFIQALIASEPNALQEDFQEQLYLLTGGNALFTIETLRSLRESGALVRDGRGIWVLRSDLNIESLPPRAEGIIAARISRLPQRLQRILTLASIEGEVFTAEIIALLAGLPVDEVISLLSDVLGKQHRLVQPQQIIRKGNQTISTYRFRHFLFQNYLYSTLDKIQRCRLHGQVGCEMERIAGDNTADYAVHLARHFKKANQAEKASYYYSLAGQRAVSMSAYPEAIKQYEEALKTLLILPENLSRNEKEIDLQLALGRAYQATVGFAHEKVGQAYHRAWTLCQSGQDAVNQITTLQLLVSYYANIADFKTAETMLNLVEEKGEELVNVPTEFSPQPHLGHAYLDSLYGKHQSVVEHCIQAINLYERISHHTSGERTGVEAGLFSNGWMGLHINWLGYPDKAKTHIQALQKIAKGYNSKLYSRDALWFSAWITLELQDWEAAKKYTENLLALTIKEGYFFYEAAAWGFKGSLLFREKKHSEAIKSIQKGLDMFYQTGSIASQTVWLQDLAKAYCAANLVDEGLTVIAKAEQIEQETGEARYKSTLQRIKGDLHQLKGDETAAEYAYYHAIDIAKTDGTKLLELEAVKRLVQLWVDQGKADQGFPNLKEVYNWFTEGFDTPMLIEAKNMLEKIYS